MKKEISIAIQTDKPVYQYSNIANLVENYGFDRISVYNDMLYQPAWLPLAKIAESTSRIKIGVAAVNPFTCHPLNIAGNIALIEEIAPKRVYLGIARGAWLDYVGIYPSNPITSLRESFIAIQHLLSGSKEPLFNKIFSIQGGDRLRWNIPQNRIPMLLGTWGEKTLKACYPFIDEFKLGGTANPEIVSRFENISDRLATENSLLNARMVVGAVTVVDEDGEEARKLAKKEVSLYLPVVANLDTTLNLDTDLLDSIKKAANNYFFDEAAEFIDDELLAKFAFAGTPEDIEKQAKNLFNAGAHCVEFGTPHGINPTDGLKLLGTNVLPELNQFLVDK